MTSSSTKSTYAQAGVDIEAGNSLVERIKPIVKTTKRVGADTDIGGFGGLFDIAAIGYNDPVLVSATDGVGTKLKIAFAMDTHDTIGIDLVAMCVNDLVVQGAEPLFFLDYFATGGLEVDKAAKVVEGIANGCKQAGCALIGGETAEMPGMYQKGHYDLAGFAVGAVERNNILPKQTIKEGDVVIGITSSGFHSNGFSLVRHVLERHSISFDDKAPFDAGTSVGAYLLEPTKIYIKSCLAAYKTGHVKAFSHITGGGLLENIPRILNDEMVVKLNQKAWDMPDVFTWVQELGNIEQAEMYRTFNCGIGMVVIVPEAEVDAVQKVIHDADQTSYVLGAVARRKDASEAQVIIQ
ncbi:MAG: phosphoribosylformylglycinamidine cyclo-ligase [Rickettsiales bacterium]|nr:phosphoribosylformylglycinamidine cyclo-ligase [Rickettsiales bacterium]